MTSAVPADRPADIVVAGGAAPDGSPVVVGVWGRDMWMLDDPVEAALTVDASGQLVTAGLVDAHVHLYRGVTPWGIDVDAAAPRAGVTTVVDAGSAGAATFDGIASQLGDLRLVEGLALVNLSRIGLVGEFDELAHPSLIDVDAAAAAVAAHRDVVVGVKARLNADTVGAQGALALDAAIELRERVGLPLMVDIYDPPPAVEEILGRLRPGDLLTHCFVPARNRLAATPDRLELVRAARARGVLLDVGHGMGSFSFADAEALLAAGIEPDTISSDLHTGCLHGPAYDLLTVLSKLVAVGLPLDRALVAATDTPRRAFGLEPVTLGGAAASGRQRADLAVLNVGETCAFDDVAGHVRAGAHLSSSLTVRKGAITHLHPRLPVRRARHYQGRETKQS